MCVHVYRISELKYLHKNPTCFEGESLIMEMFLTGPTFWKEASLFLFCKTFHTPSMLKLKQPQPRCHLSVPGGGEFAARALPAPPADGEHDRNGSISVP